MNWRANGTAVTFLEELHYYPFGMLMEGIGTAAVTLNAYKYNSKELNTDLGLNWSDYGARWYDASVGRWWSVDPMAEKYVGWSPYCYVMSSPIRLTDPDGKSVETDYYDVKGKKIGSDGINNGEKKIVLTKESAMIIKESMKKQGKFTRESSYDDIIRLHTAQEIAALDKVYSKTEGGKPHEEGFLAGSDPNGNLVISDFPPGPDVTADASASLNASQVLDTEQKHIDSGAPIEYMAHSHPWYSIETPNVTRVGGTPAPSGKVGDNGDYNYQYALEKKYNTKYGIILGYTKDGGKKMINFYNSRRSINTIEYNKYKSTVEKINNQ